MPLVAVLDTTFADVNAFIDGANGLHATLLAAGWTLLEEIDGDPDEQDRVYFSNGDDGTEALYLRATHTLVTRQVHFRAYSWWDSANGVGYDAVGDIIGGTCIQLEAPCDAWITATAEQVAVVADVGGGVYNKFYGGKVDRAEPEQRSGRTTIVGAPTSGFNEAGDDKIYVASGTDFTKFEAGQYIWLVAQLLPPLAGATELKLITGVDGPARTIFVDPADPLDYDYGAGALVGSDTQPMVLWGDSGGVLTAATPYALHSDDAYTDTVLDWPANYPEALIAGNVPLAPIALFTAAGDYHPGTVPLLRWAPAGLADEDDFEDGTTTYVHFIDGAVGLALRTA